MTEVSEPELVARLRRGDPDAFDVAYERHAPRLFRFLMRLCQRRHVAEDVLQETWLRLATRCRELAPDTEVAAWLFTVARNAWLSRARVERRVVGLESAGESPAVSPGPEAQASSTSDVRALERALGVLAETDREILLLVGVEELEHAVAARILGLGDAAFRQRLHRARARLASELGRFPEPLAVPEGTDA